MKWGITLGLLIFVFFLAFPVKANAQVRINEFVSNGNPEWVEFYNASPSAEYLKSYYIDDDNNFSDDTGSSAKKLLTDLTTSSTVYPYLNLSSFLNNSGDDVVLFSQDGAVVDQFTFGSDPGQEVAIGRSPDQTGNFYTLISTSKGAQNSSPQPSPTTAPTQAPTPTPTQTSSPTPTPTKSPSPTPTKSPTISPTPRPTTSQAPINLAQGEVLGLGVNASPSPTLVASENVSGKKLPLAAVLFISGGLAFVGLALFMFFRSYQKDKEPPQQY